MNPSRLARIVWLVRLRERIQVSPKLVERLVHGAELLYGRLLDFQVVLARDLEQKHLRAHETGRQVTGGHREDPDSRLDVLREVGGAILNLPQPSQELESVL